MPKKAACTQPTAQTEQSLNLNSAHEMPAVLTRRDLAHIRQPCTMTKSKLRILPMRRLPATSPAAAKGCMMTTAMAKAKTPVARHCHCRIHPRNLVPAQRPPRRNHHQTIRPLNLSDIRHVQLQTNRALLRGDYRKSAGFPYKANPCHNESGADAQCGVCRATPAVHKRHSNLKEI